MVFEPMAMNLREVLKKVRMRPSESVSVACHGTAGRVLTVRAFESGADVQYGRNVGLSILAVQKFAKQMLISLKHLKNCGVLHADIKLDNILVNDKHNLIKVRLRESLRVYAPGCCSVVAEPDREPPLSLFSRCVTSAPRCSLGRTRSRPTWCHDFTARRRWCWAWSTRSQWICGLSDAVCSSFSRERWLSRASPTTKWY